MTTADPRRIETDVLVIGGGMAGAFAALTAQAQGLSVTLVDKGTVGRSGSTPWANGFCVFDEAEGHDRDEWISGVRTSSDYVNNLDWLDQLLDQSKDRWEDLEAWGVFDEAARHPSLVLRDKLVAGAPTALPGEESEVVSALVGLGYSQAEALEAVAKSELPPDAPVEERVRLALGYFARERAGGE